MQEISRPNVMSDLGIGDAAGTAGSIGAAGKRPDISVAFVGPRNDMEAMIAELWLDALKLDRVGVHDGFFEVGGNSILAMQVLKQADANLGISVDAQSLFACFTVETHSALAGRRLAPCAWRKCPMRRSTASCGPDHAPVMGDRTGLRTSTRTRSRAGRGARSG